MASTTTSAILALPLEVRHQIYRYAWTVQVDTNKHIEQGFPCCLNKSYLKLQVGHVHTLVSICRQMRYEVLPEYFQRTQIYLRWHRGQLALHTFVLNNAPLPEFDAPRCIQSFRLLTQYTQHVSLQWEPCLCLISPEGTRTENPALDWLLRLERLTTLKLVISNRWVILMEGLYAMVPDRDVKANDLFICSHYFPKLMKLRNLGKVVVKVLADSNSTVMEKGEVEGLTWLSSTKKSRMWS